MRTIIDEIILMTEERRRCIFTVVKSGKKIFIGDILELLSHEELIGCETKIISNSYDVTFEIK